MENEGQIVNRNDASSEPDRDTPRAWQKYWTDEMSAADKRFRKYRRQGNAITRRFLDERSSYSYGGDDVAINSSSHGLSRLNLFWQNVDTQMSMLYGSVPKIDVSREHQDPDDDVARVASLLVQRILSADISDSGKDLSTTLRACLQDRLLPGMGIAKVRYEMDSEMVKNPDTLGFEEQPEIEVVTDERAPIDYVHWQDARWGWGRTWAEIPWWGFRSYLTFEEAKKRFGEKNADKLEYKNQVPTGEEGKDENSDRDLHDNVMKAEVWEFWRIADRTVHFWSKGCGVLLDKKSDPLQLDGFWPMPRPMIANVTTSLFMPKADFTMAQDLYNEIDELNTRIRMITKAIKVVGVYDKAAGASVGRMLKEGYENDLIPVDNWAMFAEKGGLKGTIDWFPVQDVTQTLETLKRGLNETIGLLNEITGLSNLIRGANTDQYTSDGTNQLTAKFGSIRIQALQEEFARFASELEGLKAEVVSKHFTVKSIARHSNAQFIPAADQDKIMAALELIQSPELRFRVNIKPESIAMVDYAQLKSERTEFLTAMATYLQSAQAVVANVGPQATPILMEMLKWGMAGFKGSDVLEGSMDRAIEMANQQAQQPQQDQGAQDGQVKLQIEQIKGQNIQMKAQMEMQKQQAKQQGDMQQMQMKIQLEMAKIKADQQADMSIEQQAHLNKLEQIDRELSANLQEIQANMAKEIRVEEVQSEMAIAEETVEHANAMQQQAAEHADIIEQLMTDASIVMSQQSGAEDA